MKRSILGRAAALASLQIATALLIAAGARADDARPTLLALEKGTLSYTVVHKLHQVTGTTQKLEGLARLQPGGPTLVQVDARVELNGIQQKQAIPVHLEPSGQRGVRAKFSFPISLDAFHVDRPELLLIKIDDRAVIAGDVLFSVRE